MDLLDGEGPIVDLLDLEPLVFRRQGVLRPCHDVSLVSERYPGAKDARGASG
jgi:hypothetical protein